MVVSMQTQTKETRLYNSMERTLGHIFALTLGIGPNNQIHSGYESFAGLFCMELSARLKMKSTESRIAILQRIWIWIQYTVRKVNFASVSYDLYIGALNFHGVLMTRHVKHLLQNQKQQLTKVFWLMFSHSQRDCRR